MQCDMCGKDGFLKRMKVEGTVMNVCQDCSKFGVPVERTALSYPRRTQRKERVEVVEFVVNNYAEIIRNARNKTGLKQEDFARQINEKESIVHKIETGHFSPSLKLARKLEKFLHIKLVERESSEPLKVNTKAEGIGGFTLGDMIKKR
jgi:putative transcription factor